MSESGTSNPSKQRLTLYGVCFLVSVLASLVLMMSVVEPLPFWDTDPSLLPFQVDVGVTSLGGLNSSYTGIGPAMCVVLCAIAVVCALPTVLLNARRPSPWTFGILSCAWVGIVAIGYHAMFRIGFDPDAARLGCAWIAGTVCGLAAWKTTGIARGLAAALVLGSIGFLTTHGLVQMYLAHPATIQEFAQTRDQFFAAKGWSADSSLAKMYERRLRQNEMSGWFGLSNVFATFSAGMAMCFGTMLVSQPRGELTAQRGRTIWLVLGLVSSLVALVGSHSKGGIGALLVGAALLFVARVVMARRSGPHKLVQRIPTLVGLLAMTIPLLGIFARGLVGTRIGELSILFRWFYISSAARIAGAYLPLGTAPDGFKQAYTTLGHPMSPEQVVSPHSVLFDLVATLGIAGVALCATIVAAAVACGRHATPATTADEPVPDNPAHQRSIVYALLAMFGLASVVAVMLQPASSLPLVVADALERLHQISPDQSLLFGGGTLVVAILVAGGIGWATYAIWEQSPILGARSLAAGALVLIVHAQIEMTPVITSATPAYCVLLGLGASGAHRHCAHTNEAGYSRVGTAFSAGLCVASVFIAVWCMVQTTRWERALVLGAVSLHPVTVMRSEVQSTPTRREAFDAIDIVSRRFSIELPPEFRPATEAQREPDAWLNAYRAHLGRETEQHLAHALALAPHHTPTLQAFVDHLVGSTVALDAASSIESGSERARLVKLVCELVQSGADARASDPVATARLLAMVASDSRFRTGPLANVDPIAAWTHLIRLDPRSIEARVRLLNLMATQIDSNPDILLSLRDQCRQALELNQRMGLDPLGQLSPEDEESLRALLRRIEADDSIGAG